MDLGLAGPDMEHMVANGAADLNMKVLLQNLTLTLSVRLTPIKVSIYVRREEVAAAARRAKGIS